MSRTEKANQPEWLSGQKINEAVFVSQFLQRHPIQNGLRTAVFHLFQCSDQVIARFLHLATGQLVSDSLCAGFAFLPVVVRVADEMGGR